MTTSEPKRRNTVRGRPVVADGHLECARCHRCMRKAAATWPDGKICNSCHYTATSRRGRCPRCGAERLLPGHVDDEDTPVCRDCAGIAQSFLCRTCNTEQRPYRRGTCARCALRHDLERDYLRGDAPDGFRTLVDALCRADRPESILTWKRSDKVQALLTALATESIPLTHDGLDGVEPHGVHVDHLRAILVHAGVLSPRDTRIARFGEWIDNRLACLSNPQITRPVRQFATWHHLKRIGDMVAAGKPIRGAVDTSKQEINEVLKFLTWLDSEHARTITACTQQDVDQWIATGTTTRHAIRTFVIWCAVTRINTAITLGFREAKTTRILTQQQRLAWIRELLTGEGESLPYRVVGLILLLYAQPVVKIVETPLSAITMTSGALTIAFGATPSPALEPFAALLREHITQRPHLRTTGADNPWLFPGSRPGDHLRPDTAVRRLRRLGIDLLGARNAALRDLVSQVPPSVVADMLGYSDKVTHHHADLAGQPWHAYPARA